MKRIKLTFTEQSFVHSDKTKLLTFKKIWKLLILSDSKRLFKCYILKQFPAEQKAKPTRQPTPWQLINVLFFM